MGYINPKDARAEAFRWLVRRLKASPKLKPYVATWWASDGVAGQEAELPDPPRGMVAIRMTPRWDTEEPFTTTGGGHVSWSSPVTVGFEIVTFGDDTDDAASIWGLILDALFPVPAQDLAALRTEHRAAGVSWIEPIRPGELRLAVFISR
jgi:hypothetical protein